MYREMYFCLVFFMLSRLTAENKMDYFAARDAAAGGASAQALAQAGAMCEVSMCQVVREFVCVCVFVLYMQICL